MCGIVTVQAREASRPPPSTAEVFAALELARAQAPFDPTTPDLAARLTAAAAHVAAADALLRGVPGIRCLAGDPSAAAGVHELVGALSSQAETLEVSLDSARHAIGPDRLEATNGALVDLRDALWSLGRDRLGATAEVLELAGRDASGSALAAFAQIQVALAAIDRLEVRGRDSAGLAVVIQHADLEAVRPLLAERVDDPLFRSMAVCVDGDRLMVVYKAAAEIGELGDNTRALRAQIASDPLLHQVVSDTAVRVQVIGHTRWASVGLISEPNAHPLASDGQPVVVAVLNGDIDNHADLREAEGLRFGGEITTDAKVIPELVSRRMAEGMPALEAFRRTVASFEGSVAIAATSLTEPDTMLLALRGSGQALYVGLAEDAYVVASEPYGLVEHARSYLRMDGESAEVTGRGQIVALRTSQAGTVEGIHRIAYDGTELPVSAAELRSSEITTRDVDRGSHPHFLLKEIEESPRSFQRTLRGKIEDTADGIEVVLGPQVLPAGVTEALWKGHLRHVRVIGQGTAAVASRAVAHAIRSALVPTSVTVEAMAATELSGFEIREDMSDVLLVAVSQSGTTADTNRTVEIAKAHGASVIAIVNRRGSDLVDRSDGVLYTSDGRDVEMAVPSTKAFYAQVAAGFLLAAGLASHVPGARGLDDDVLRALLELPEAMRAVLELRPEIAEMARLHAPQRRYWAVVGNGTNHIAAEELRIKLSELCYKSVACDVTEEKKHIDLSAEPLIFVCAAGLSSSNATDVAKEIAYFRAHKAAPIVVAGEGEGAYEAALEVIRVPAVHREVAFVLSAMAGHLFGYEAALAIDAQAHLLREARAAVEEASARSRDAHRLLEGLREVLRPIGSRFMDALRAGSYDGHLEASKAVRIASLFRYATGVTPLDHYQIEHGKVGTPSEVVGDLVDALTAGIDELTRPVDAIRHQAKTVTVGITRSDETLLQVPLVGEVLGAGVARDRLTYGTLRTLAALDAAVDRVAGFTHYAIESGVDGEASVHVTDRGGIARDIPSRTDRDPRLRGTKHRVAVEREVLVTRGRSDQRTIMVVPEVKGAETTGIVVLHVSLHERLPADVMRSVLEGYRDRFSALRDLVTETEPTFREDLLSEIDVGEVLIGSIQLLADRWRAS